MTTKRLAVVLIAALASACGAGPQVTTDTTYVQILRVRITKARNAIEETRGTIARSGGAPYLPELYVRLAELLSEEASYHYRVAQERQQGSEVLEVPQVKLLKEQAIAIYGRVLRDYPDTPLRARVLFNTAQEYRELGDFEQMIATLRTLVDAGESRFLGQALLLLGDYHFDQNELDEARRRYERVLQTSGPQLGALARYKLAWVAVNQDDCERALRSFERAIELGNAAAERAEARAAAAEAQAELEEAVAEGSEAVAAVEAERAAEGSLISEAYEASLDDDVDLATLGGDYAIDVRRSSIRDLAYCYTAERNPERAVPYLRRLAHDRASYAAGLSRMARRLGVVDSANGVLRVLRELLRFGVVDEERLDDARQMHTALRSQNLYTNIGRDLGLMLRVLRTYQARLAVGLEQRETLTNEFEEYARDLLTRAQARIPEVSERRRRLFAARVTDGYSIYLDTFPEGDATTSMMLNAADSAVAAGRQVEAAEYSLRASDRLAEGDAERRDALYDAVVRFQEVLETSDAGDLSGRALARSGLRRAATELLRYELEPDVSRRVKFGIALSYFDSGSYLEAIDLLTAVAYEYPRTEEGDSAIRLVLDSHATLNEFEALAAAGRAFGDDEGPATAALRAEIQPVIASAEQALLDEVSLEASGEEGGDLTPLVAFAERNEGSELGERALLNAFIAARAQGESETLYALGEQFADQYPDSEQLPGMLSTLGQIAVGRFEVAQAIDFLRQAAGAGHPQAPQLLVIVGGLQEQLADAEGAAATYVQAIQSADTPTAQAEPLGKLATLLERQGDWSRLEQRLGPYVGGGDIEVLVRVALAKLAGGRGQEAEMDFQTVIGAGAAASTGALARAHFGTAEVLRESFESYPALDDAYLVEEYVTIVDVIQQSYLQAVRQQDPDYSPMALLRLASMQRAAAAKVGAFRPGGDVDAATRDALASALGQRQEAMEATAEEALEVCARQAWNARSFSPAARACLEGDIPRGALPTFDVPASSDELAPEVAPELRERLARNPEDVEALRGLAEAFLREGAPGHARVVLTAAAERGGGATEANLLGLAHHELGDEAAALKAFAYAAAEGLEAGRQNLSTVLAELGLPGAADEALETFPEGRPGGREIGGGQ
ncbi:MAG: tetratricopeptide repeat protein [Myxococcota bacterium]